MFTLRYRGVEFARQRANHGGPVIQLRYRRNRGLHRSAPDSVQSAQLRYRGVPYTRAGSDPSMGEQRI